MAQFDVYENSNPETSELYPCLLDVQADILGDLPTRIVVPLVNASAVIKPIPILQPELEIKGQRFYLQAAQLAGVSQSVLGFRICSAKASRDKIIAALDFAFVGY
jgi:toxin CcdB